jgi:hypothetical protein
LHRRDGRELGGERQLPGAADEGTGCGGERSTVEACRRWRRRQPGPQDVECLSCAGRGVDSIGRHDPPATAGAQQVRQRPGRGRLDRPGERIDERLPDPQDGLVTGQDVRRWRVIRGHDRAVLGHRAQGRGTSADHAGQGGSGGVCLPVSTVDRGVAVCVHLLAGEALDGGQLESDGVDRFETEVGE